MSKEKKIIENRFQIEVVELSNKISIHTRFFIEPDLLSKIEVSAGLTGCRRLNNYCIEVTFARLFDWQEISSNLRNIIEEYNIKNQ